MTKWRYQLWKVDGVAKPVSFIMILVFRLDETGNEDNEAIIKKHDDLIKSKKIMKELPLLMEVVFIESES